RKSNQRRIELFQSAIGFVELKKGVASHVPHKSGEARQTHRLVAVLHGLIKRLTENGPYYTSSCKRFSAIALQPKSFVVVGQCFLVFALVRERRPSAKERFCRLGWLRSFECNRKI